MNFQPRALPAPRLELGRSGHLVAVRPSRLVSRARCATTGHDPSWVHGVSLGFEYPVCRCCGTHFADRPVAADPRTA